MAEQGVHGGHWLILLTVGQSNDLLQVYAHASTLMHEL
jgi:hypothetical protein